MLALRCSTLRPPHHSLPFQLQLQLQPKFQSQAVRHATKKAGGSSKNGRDSPGQHYGVKLWGGSKVVSGNIIVTQRGTRYRPGEGVKIARNHTLFSVLGKHDEGEEYVVKYEKVVHNTKQRNLVSVVKRKDYNFGSASAPVFLGTTKEQKAIRVARALEKTALLMAEAQRSRLGGEGKFATSHI